MWAFGDVWRRWIKGGVGGLLWHLKLVWNDRKMEKCVCILCVILVEDG
jgi:hypothetical protein